MVVDRSGNDIVVTEVGSGITMVADPVLPIDSKRTPWFDSAADTGWIRISGPTAMSPSLPWTTVQFVKRSDVGSSSQGIHMRSTGESTLRLISLEANSGVPKIWVLEDIGWQIKCTGTQLTIGEWYCVVASHDGSGTLQLRQFLADGTKQTLPTATGDYDPLYPTAGADPSIGGEYTPNIEFNGYIWGGSHYDNELSDAQIQEWMKNPFAFAKDNYSDLDYMVVGDGQGVANANFFDIGPNDYTVTTGTMDGSFGYDPIRIPLASPTSNEMLRYNLDEGTGSSAADAAGYEQTGDPTLDSGVTPGEIGSSDYILWGADLRGVCLIGTGDATDAFHSGERPIDVLTHFKTMDGAPDATMTIIAWAFSEVAAPSGGRIFGLSESTSDQTLQLNQYHSSPYGPELRLWLGNPGALTSFRHDVVMRSTDPPEHIVGWHNGAVATDTHIYRDILLENADSQTGNGDFSAWADDTNQRIVVMNEVGGGLVRALEGRLYRARLLDIAMTPLQIAEDFYAGPDPAPYGYTTYDAPAGGPTEYQEDVAGVQALAGAIIKAVKFIIRHPSP